MWLAKLNSSDIRIAVSGWMPCSSPLPRRKENSTSPVAAKLASCTGISRANTAMSTSERLPAASSMVGHACQTMMPTRIAVTRLTQKRSDGRRLCSDAVIR